MLKFIGGMIFVVVGGCTIVVAEKIGECIGKFKSMRKIATMNDKEYEEFEEIIRMRNNFRRY